MSDFQAFTRRLIDRLAEQDALIESLHRRLNNLVREGTVTDVDFEKGKARVKHGELDSPALSWATRSGSQQEWDPVAKGERVLVLSPTGDPAQGIILPGGYSDEFAQPYDKGKSWYRKVGNATLLMDDEQITLTIGATSLKITAGGLTLTSGGSSFDLTPDATTLATPNFHGKKT